MKDYMIVIGLELVDNNMMQVSLIPEIRVKPKKPSLMDLASGGLEMIQKAALGDKQYKTVHYISKQSGDALGLVVGSKVILGLESQELI